MEEPNARISEGIVCRKLIMRVCDENSVNIVGLYDSISGAADIGKENFEWRISS